MFKKVTIKDIADLVGVSKATVSYYLNGNYKKMSLETKEKIREAIEETGFQPSRIAKSLVTKDTQTIGAVVADITNPFTSVLIKGIYDTCKQYGYAVNITNSDNDILAELDNLNRMAQQNVSGLILDSVNPNHPRLSHLDNNRMVMVDRQAEKLVVDTIVADNQYSTQVFLEMMKAKGYEDIYFVTFPIKGISTRELRYEGFKASVSQDSSKLIVLGEADTERRISEILRHKKQKTAFFTMNGPCLLAFMKIINHQKAAYPTDFGLGSYEDLAWMEVLSPNVSCIRQDSYQIGCLATKHLISKLKGEVFATYPHLIEVANSIVLRNSF